MRTPLSVMVVVAAGLFGLWLLTHEREEPARTPPAASVRTIAERVEELRAAVGAEAVDTVLDRILAALRPPDTDDVTLVGIGRD